MIIEHSDLITSLQKMIKAKQLNGNSVVYWDYDEEKWKIDNRFIGGKI